MNIRCNASTGLPRIKQHQLSLSGVVANFLNDVQTDLF